MVLVVSMFIKDLDKSNLILGTSQFLQLLQLPLKNTANFKSGQKVT